ncbi:MAG: hypothetical protein K6B52_02535 [Clostridiales bacterium]|nr:hypothetical protein [Clostridiales bacterium]
MPTADTDSHTAGGTVGTVINRPMFPECADPVETVINRPMINEYTAFMRVYEEIITKKKQALKRNRNTINK